MSQTYIKRIHIEDDKDIYASKIMNKNKALHSMMNYDKQIINHQKM